MRLQDLLYPLSSFDWFSRCGLNYFTLWAVVFFWIFAFGACWGSFMNVCIWRIPRGESLAKRASHCGSCDQEIHWYDNIPVVSYLVLRGKCRHCHQPYSPRYLAVEMLCGTLFAGTFLKLGETWQPPELFFNYAVAILYCVAVAWIDAEHRIIPDKLTYPTIIAALCGAVVLPEAWGVNSRISALVIAAASGTFPALLLALFAIAGRWISHREVLGWGDVKFIWAIGMLIGMPGTFFTMIAGSFAGTVYGTVYALTHKRSLKKLTIAFGPFMAAAVILWIFTGQFVCRWYIALQNLKVLNL